MNRQNLTKAIFTRAIFAHVHYDYGQTASGQADRLLNFIFNHREKDICKIRQKQYLLT